jgi:YbbR domain-containing protein
MSFLYRNWELKISALLLATALWVFVVTSEKSDLVVAAPVELDGLPTSLQVVGERPETVDVQLHGLRTTLARLPLEQVRAHVSLAGARPGEVTVRLGPEQIVAPPGITVVRVSPSRMRLVLEPRRSSATPERRGV